MRASIYVALATLLAADPAIAGPALSTAWSRADIPQQDCIRRAERVVTAFRPEQVTNNGRSVYGWNRSYTWTVRCAADEGFVIFAVAGPELSESQRLVDDLRSRF